MPEYTNEEKGLNLIRRANSPELTTDNPDVCFYVLEDYRRALFSAGEEMVMRHKWQEHKSRDVSAYTRNPSIFLEILESAEDTDGDEDFFSTESPMEYEEDVDNLIESLTKEIVWPHQPP